ncbi:MAG: hypothetical protein O7G31_16415, partial [Calditrichaeota bacterium]|nr:hypothetical protein [Calditrichota bacterium]
RKSVSWFLEKNILRRATPAGVPPNGGFYDSCASAPPLEEAPAARAGHRRTAAPDEEAGAAPAPEDPYAASIRTSREIPNSK